jgi:LysR family transcriptional regulator, nitrogen assimilation regulatory protein
MELRHLRYFVQIVDSQSLSGAARVLGVAQPALSQQIAQLEAQLGLMLLTRSVRGVQATKSGEAFYNQAKSILRQLADIPTIIAAADEAEAGTVSIGLPASIASLIGDLLIVRIAERLPQVSLEISEFPSGYLAELLTTARLELAVLVADSIPRGVKSEVLLKEDILVVGKPDALPSSSSISLERLASMPLIGPPRANDLRRRIDGAFAAIGLYASYKCQIDGTSLATRAVKRGLGVSLIPWSAAHEDLSSGALEMRDIKDCRICRVAKLSWLGVLPISPIAQRIKLEMVALVRELVVSGQWPRASLP